MIVSKPSLSAPKSHGTGKTTSPTNAEGTIQCGEGLVVVDMKGGDTPTTLAAYAEKYNRTFRHWTTRDLPESDTDPSSNEPAYYDPLADWGAAPREAVNRIVLSHVAQKGEVAVFTIPSSLGAERIGFMLDSIIEDLRAMYSEEALFEGTPLRVVLEEATSNPDLDDLISRCRKSNDDYSESKWGKHPS